MSLPLITCISIKILTRHKHIDNMYLHTYIVCTKDIKRSYLRKHVRFYRKTQYTRTYYHNTSNIMNLKET